MADLVGTKIDRYLVRERIGDGGMAVVYKAFNTRLDSEVAIKVIRTEKLSPEISERALKRFEREAKSLAQLTHSNIVGVIDYGEYEGQPYLVMELLRGGSLKDFLGKPMPWQQAVRLLIPAAQALGYAHKHNIIHRDVKPSNILLTESGQPMLADFGIAKIIEEDVTIDLTGTRGAIGTPEYMSPEQGLGKAVDSRTDIYALGVVLYELVTGQKPFRGETPMETLFKHVNDPLPRPTKFIAGLPLSIENLLVKSLAKNPRDRYDSMDDLVAALEEALQGKVKPPRRKPEPRQKEQDAGRKLWPQFVDAVKALVKKMMDLTSRMKIRLAARKPIGIPRQTWYFVFPGLAVIIIVGIVLWAISLRQAKNASVAPLSAGQNTGDPVGTYYVSNSSGKRQIYYSSTNGVQQVSQESGKAESWAPAPDGHGNLYYVSTQSGETDIYVLASNNKIQKVTTTQGTANSWAPAPDGHGNLYYVSDRSGEIDIYVLSPKGRTVRVTTTQGTANSWAPAPDGHGNLYYVSDRSGEIDIYVLSPKGKTTRVTITQGAANSWSPAPDGQGNLYYVSDRSGEIDIYVLSSKGKTNRVTTTRGAANSWAPAPDGHGNLYYVSDRSGTIHTYILTSGGETKRVATIPTSAESWLRESEDQPDNRP